MLKFYNADFQGRVLLARKKAFRGRSLFFVKSNKRLSHKIRFMVNPSKLRRKNLTFAGLSFIMKQRLRRYYAHLKEHQFLVVNLLWRESKKRVEGCLLLVIFCVCLSRVWMLQFSDLIFLVWAVYGS